LDIHRPGFVGHRLSLWRWLFSGVHELSDNFKPSLCFSAVKQGLILEKETEKSTHLIELDARKLLVVSMSQRNQNLRLYDLV
jgi:hypothetical protein